MHFQLRKSFISLLFVLSVAGCKNNLENKPALNQDVTRATDTLALTPPMGWNSWNGLGKVVSEELIKAVADSFVTSGLKDAGYTYIVIDDLWHGGRDSSNGMLYPDPERFPSGMKALADYVHAKGLKFGIYSDAGTKTCGDQPGSFGYEENDARQFASWGVDYLKYDYCYCNDNASLNNDYRMAFERYKKMGDALKATGRPIVLSICEWGPRSPWLWGREAGGQLWRTSYDVADRWDVSRNETSPIGILTSIDVMCDLERFAGPGGWNDPDMLVVGLGNSGFIKGGGCTEAEYRTQMSMWCMFSAPLMIGCDIRKMDETAKKILLNHDIISIDQDPLGKQAFRVWRKDGAEAYKKPLSGNRTAVAFLNRNSVVNKITVKYGELELDTAAKFNVYDVWEHKIVNRQNDLFSVTLEPHETVVYLLTND